ncbi:hypothetical protein [Microbulbifer rhizosphaerae]|uniref:WD40 repeat protein n=1 Tax=Microbulbifer rhizosphaerae TaxID=1562603 RepID=A0A7W4WFR6_9GAMM|nr:hypothetical protein [Microbulbifer rhizosphaerae]MBB3062811.1 WD40 repeat protein [Microbulbifer rhizosphaerae]
MTYYRIKADKDTYGWFELDMDKVLRALGRKTFSNFTKTDASIIDKWEDFDARFDPPDGEVVVSARPDITSWGSTCRLVLNEKAFGVLKRLLSPYGEFLITPCEGQRYRIFNCRTTKPADESKSQKEMMNGLQTGLINLDFDPTDIAGAPVFKTDYDLFGSLYCDEQFKSLVEENSLTGITLREDLATSPLL